MKCFELWLDESGTFDNDTATQKGYHPSLIGGLLSIKGELSQAKIKSIIHDKHSHGSEENYRDTFSKFEKITQEPVRFVVFSNSECVMVLDKVATYLNVMAEGLIKLIKQLKAEHQNIHLHILIANRPDFRLSGEPVVLEKEYEYRLKERLIMSGLRNAIDERDWSLETASARKDKRLMLADNICNVFFTRDTKFKHDPSMQTYINQIYNNKNRTLVFSLREDTVEGQFYRWMAEGRIGEAVALLCESENSAFLPKGMEMAIHRFECMEENEALLQYRLISNLFEFHLKVKRDLELCKRFCRNLLDYFIPAFENYGMNHYDDFVAKLRFDIKFYLLTTYTHQGNIKAAGSLINECDKEIRFLPYTWEFVEYRIQYLNRKIIHKENCFDFNGALEDSNKLVQQCEAMKSALELAAEDEIPELHYPQLAKALGTRSRMYIFQLYNHPEYYEKARADSEWAIREFDREGDKRRQYSLRVQLETNAGHFDDALHFLYLCEGVEKEAGLKALVKKIESNNFSLMNYLRLMAEGKRQGWKTASLMYEHICKSRLLQENDTDIPRQHPFEICFWKLGTYLAFDNRRKAAMRMYDKAIEICFDQSDHQTLHIIGLAVEFEKYSMELKMTGKAPETARSLGRHHQKIQDSFPSEQAKALFAEVDFQNKDANYYFEISRRVTY